MSKKIEINASPTRAAELTAQLSALQTQAIGTVSFPSDLGETPAALSRLATEICVLDTQLTTLVQATSVLLTSTLQRYADADTDIAESL